MRLECHFAIQKKDQHFLYINSLIASRRFQTCNQQLTAAVKCNG